MVAWAVEFVELHDLPQAALATLATTLAALAAWARMATRSMRAAIVRERLTRAGGAPIVLGAIFTLTVLVAVTEERLEPEAHAPDEIVGQLDRLVRDTAHRLAQWSAVRRVAAELSQLAEGGLAAVVLGTLGTSWGAAAVEKRVSCLAEPSGPPFSPRGSSRFLRCRGRACWSRSVAHRWGMDFRARTP